jgi:hypothetical protein
MMAGAFLNAPVLAVGAADFPGGVRVRYAAYTVTTADGRPTAARVFAVKQQLSATGGENTAVAAADVAVPVSDLGYGHTGDEAVGSLHAVLPSLGTLDVRLTAPVTGHGSITSLHAVQWNYNLTIDEGHQKTDVIAAHSYVRLDGVAGVVYEAAWGRGASGYVRSAYPVVPTAPA